MAIICEFQRRRDVVIVMLKENISLALIARVTEFSMNEISEIQLQVFSNKCIESSVMK